MKEKTMNSLATHDFPEIPEVVQRRGEGDAASLRMGIVVSRFNGPWTRALLTGACEVLQAGGVPPAHIQVAWVPGAFEIPVVVAEWARAQSMDALMALGVVVQGDTPHAELITRTVTHQLSRISVDQGIPILDGVVAAHTSEQAAVRCGEGPENRGRHAASAALEMACLLRGMREGSS